MENIKMAKVVEEEQLAEQNSMEQGLSASFLQLPDVCSAVCFLEADLEHRNGCLQHHNQEHARFSVCLPWRPLLKDGISNLVMLAFHIL